LISNTLRYSTVDLNSQCYQVTKVTRNARDWRQSADTASLPRATERVELRGKRTSRRFLFSEKIFSIGIEDILFTVFFVYYSLTTIHSPPVCVEPFRRTDRGTNQSPIVRFLLAPLFLLPTHPYFCRSIGRRSPESIY